MKQNSTVLVIGSGGREHALALRLLESPNVGRVVVSPGNAGTAGNGLENQSRSPLEVAKMLQPDLVVVGPEQPLCDGLVDELSGAGFVSFGPSRAAAQLEASKAFMKDFAVRHGIRTARHVTVSSEPALDAALAEFSTPPVIKATGLCAGKGVVVAETFDEAREAALGMLRGDSFGDAGTTIVIEERLLGREVSVHAICDGERAFVLPPIQDHKRIGEGDTGPNTGGMGTFGPSPVVTPELSEIIQRDIVERTVQGMAQDGAPFRGTLFAGLMISPVGEPVLLEINVRFGDPETQVLMNLIDGDFAELLHSAALGALKPESVTLNNHHGLCVVLAAAGYPAKPRSGDVITGLDAATALGGVRIYHAGTQRDGEQVLTSGGRVLGVTATGATFDEARALAYAACDRIDFAGKQFRRDIGASLDREGSAR